MVRIRAATAKKSRSIKKCSDFDSDTSWDTAEKSEDSTDYGLQE